VIEFDLPKCALKIQSSDKASPWGDMSVPVFYVDYCENLVSIEFALLSPLVK